MNEVRFRNMNETSSHWPLAHDNLPPVRLIKSPIDTLYQMRSKSLMLQCST